MAVPAIKLKEDEIAVDEVVLDYLQRYAQGRDDVQILEAGCGWRWRFDLSGLPVTLTGIDVDEDALRLRQEVKKDLDKVIHGDLTQVDLNAQAFDIVYSAYVLEHVIGARKAMQNISTWLKPGGLLIIKIPDRDSVYGFVTRITPHWFHIYYKRYLVGLKNAGKPGHGPYPTVHEPIIATDQLFEFARTHGLTLREHYCYGELPAYQRLFTSLVSALSFGKLRPDHHNLMLIFEKSLTA